MRVPGWREERAPGASPPQFNNWVMWILLRMARTGPGPHPAAGWPRAQFFPMPRKGGIQRKWGEDH